MLPSFLANALNLVFILLGFGLVIVIHEFGHFIAARWAGVRVQTFSVGFGRAIVSYRPGFGWQSGSSTRRYEQLVQAANGPVGQARDAAEAELAAGVGPTEYRLSVVPLGGYVKMLGQDDADPGHRSSEPDSYNSAAVWKRMVIISAGVVFNVLIAVVLFVVAFSMGLETPPAEVGAVERGSAAAIATPINAEVGPGLERADIIRSIDGRPIRSFQDVFISVAMSDARKPVRVQVDRPNVGSLTFEATPTPGELTDLLELGVSAARSNTLIDPPKGQEEIFREGMASFGAEGVPPESKLVLVAGEAVDRSGALSLALTDSLGSNVGVEFVTPGGESLTHLIAGVPVLEVAAVPGPNGLVQTEHLLGFRPVMSVGELGEDQPGYAKGLRTGDVFVRLGLTEFPTVEQGLRAIRAASGKSIDAVVRRATSDGETEDIPLELAVSKQGLVGFSLGDTRTETRLVGAALEETPAEAAGVFPGTEVLSVNGVETASFAAFVSEAVRLARAGEEIRVTLLDPIAGSEPREVVLNADTELLAATRWRPAGPGLGFFEPVTIVLRGSNPIESAMLGFGETRRIMETTYLTFIRLFQGSIRVEKLSGPIGIVHVGTLFADRGLAWVLFFFGMVSINLAVINFLPVPITDGGHMVFLAWEQLTGRPVSVVVQNIASLAGLAVLGVVFLVVTYNDILRLLGISG